MLDGVQDPGNVGTLWRTADAFGADGMILPPGCVRPLELPIDPARRPLGARASACLCGRGALGDLVPKLAQAGLPLYATALREDTVDLREMDLRRCAIAIGSEGRGVSQAVLDASAKTCEDPHGRTMRIPQRRHRRGRWCCGRWGLEDKPGAAPVLPCGARARFCL